MKEAVYPEGGFSSRSLIIWRIAQIAVWLAGAGILTCLLFFPKTGLLLFWNALIPLAPALFVVSAGTWRNICPLATTNLLPRHLGLSRGRILSPTRLGQLNLIAVVAFLVIVPLRHSLFNQNGVATGIMIFCMAAIGVTLGFFYEWKSAWCSGLCPVHPVEKLYGGNVFLSVANANCQPCMHCTSPCPDSTPGLHPRVAAKDVFQRASALLVTGGLPGFIWGWFQVPDGATEVYGTPLAGFACTLAAYLVLRVVIPLKYERGLAALFAASGVSIYYWYRIPSLLGFGAFPGDGLLINLRGLLPPWSLTAMTIATTLFFFYRLFIVRRGNKSWMARPPRQTLAA